MSTVTSTDGTTIAYDRVGQGPAVVLVDGALCHRASGPNTPLAQALSRHFTVYTYDRRGRGESGDTAPFAPQREIEDLAAVVEEAGAPVCLYGISSGAALALDAVESGVPVEKLAVYEPPFVLDGTRPPIPADYTEQLGRLVAEGRRADAVRYFMRRGVGLPGVVVAMMRLMPAWSGLKAVAHTLPYDAAFVARYERGTPIPAGTWSSVKVPTLAVSGGKSPAWMRNGVRSLAEVLPDAEHHTLEGQTHIVKPEALVPVLEAFFR
ncbi:alpha/beta fold hydrolase [Nonomuraea sp. NPDC005983]|uniref:alpha/beta fold hydrolase n=1 Tax=Nonomuraea sp. NPDC005983 TaxID=3155595 RepID=UPI0033B4BE63